MALCTPVDTPFAWAAPQISLESHFRSSPWARRSHRVLCIWSPGSLSSLSLTFTPISSVPGQAPTSSHMDGLPAPPTSIPSQRVVAPEEVFSNAIPSKIIPHWLLTPKDVSSPPRPSHCLPPQFSSWTSQLHPGLCFSKGAAGPALVRRCLRSQVECRHQQKARRQ